VSVSSLLLRVLLSVSLVMNGAGLAQASTRMQLEHSGHQTHSLQVTAAMTLQAAEEVPCHDHEEPGRAKPAADPPRDNAASLHTGDCCKGEVCGCACAQHAPVVFTPCVQATVAVLHLGSAARLASQHRPPALPHLIRPPIG
jgi:hypothetical protein